MRKVLARLLGIKPVVVRDSQMQALTEMLFPATESQRQGEHTFVIDYATDTNLYSAIIDLEEGMNDAVTLKTLRNVLERLRQARALLRVEDVVMPEGGYLVVDSPQAARK